MVFGRDGAHPDAPKWHPLLWGHLPYEFKRQAQHHQMVGLGVCVVSEMPRPLARKPSGNTAAIQDAAIDLRIPSVAARLTALCVDVLFSPSSQPRGCFLSAIGTAENGYIVLGASWGLLGHYQHVWSRSTGRDDERCDGHDPRRNNDRPSGVVLPPGCDALGAIRALTIALAPRIAMLGKP